VSPKKAADQKAILRISEDWQKSRGQWGHSAPRSGARPDAVLPNAQPHYPERITSHGLPTY